MSNIPNFSQAKWAQIASSRINQDSLVRARAAQLDPKIQQNFDAIVGKYPNMSKDAILAAVKKGITPDMQGLDKIATADGLAQLIKDKTNIQDLPRMAKEDKFFAQSIWDNFYAGFKGTTRVAFAALQNPYQAITNTFRNLYALNKGQISSAQAFSDSAKGFLGMSKSTNFGSIMNDLADGGQFLDVGTGFFVDPNSKVGKAQKDAMSAYGLVAGKSYTIGRGTLSALGAHPESTAYRVISGVIDATLNVATDPTTWVGPGAVTGVIRGGAKAKGAVEAAREARGVINSETQALRKELSKLRKEATAGRKDARRQLVDDVDIKLDELTKKEQALLEAEQKRALKLYTAGVSRSKTAASAEAKAAIDDKKLSAFLNDITQSNASGDTVNLLGKLSADNQNSKMLFEDGLFFDELPTTNKLTLSAQGDKEFVTSLIGNKPLKIIDITAPANAFDEKELARWVKFAEYLQSSSKRKNLSPSIKSALKEIAGEPASAIAPGSSKMVDPVLFGRASLADVIRKTVEIDARFPNQMQGSGVADIVMNGITKFWKADGFSNIRAISGGTGGVVLTNMAKIAAREVKLSNTLVKGAAPRLGQQTIIKLDEVLANADEELKVAKKALDDSKITRKEFDARMREIRAARAEYAKDPDALKKLINDPNDIGLSKYVNLTEQIITKEDQLREALNVEAGLIGAFGGRADANIEKALNYVLGKKFAPIVKVIAKENSALRIKRLLGNKAPIEMVDELARAKDIGAVESVFLKYLGALNTDPIQFRGTLLKLAGQVEKTTSPLLKVVPNYRLHKALAWAEKAEKQLGSFYTRTAVLPLDDLDRLVNGLDDWMISAGIGDNVSEKLINDIIAAENSQQRSGALFRALESSYEEIARQATAKNPENFEKALEAIKETFRASGKDNVIARAYMPMRNATDSLPTGMILGGKQVSIPKDTALFEYQMLDDIVKLPDSRDVKNLFRQYNDIAIIKGAKTAKEILDNNLGDRWRTAQLAFRAAFILRNVGEMQVRMYLSGHESLFNHPLEFIAMMAANPNGNAAQKLATRFSKYNNDLLGNSLLDDSIVKGINSVVDQHFEFLNRQMYSYGNNNQWVGKIYETVDNTSDRYHVGLANTLSNFRGDRFITGVARADTPALQEKFLQELVGSGNRSSDALIDLIMGGKSNGLDDTSFWAEALLKEIPPGGKLTPADIRPDNINVSNLRAWLFDETEGQGSVINALNNVTAKNPYMRRLIGDGEVTMPNGKVLKMPIYKYSEDAKVRRMQGKEFKTELISAFPAKDMTGSTVIYNSTKTQKFGGTGWGPLDGAIDRFFDLGTRIENVAVYGPEFRMSYWDYAGKYASMLNNSDLAKAYKEAQRTLAPIRKGNMQAGRSHPTLKAMKKEIERRKKNNLNPKPLISLREMNSLAGNSATKYTKNLFYDAARQRNIAAQWRIIFPFAQAQFNTISKWAELALKNPVQPYKFMRAYNSLTQPGSSAIYDLTGIEYDDNQGFFYKDEFGETRFRYPLAGSIMGGLVGKNLSGTDTANALQFTAPAQALNLAFGAVNPLVPGIGPVGSFAMQVTGRDEAFGPTNEFLRNIIMPFGVKGEQEGPIESLFPSWLKKSVMSFVNNDKVINQNLKPWAEYLASSGAYGDNPLADDEARTQLFKDARQMSRWLTFLQGFFQSIAPATPSQEVFANDKNGQLMTQTLLYKSWDDIRKNNPGDYYAAVREFSDTFGEKNLLTILGGSTTAVQGTQDAWAFLNNNPDLVTKYAVKDQDIVPYFFPGGEAAIAYYNWQVRTGTREKKTQAELSQEAEALVYAMRKSQISETQAEYGKSNLWYVNQVRALGPEPIAVNRTGVGENRLAEIGKALQEPAFQESPVYKETAQFYEAFKERQDRLNVVKTSVTASFGGKSYLARKMQEELDNLANQLMLQNPAFSRMYYGVFAGQLKVENK